MMRSLYSGVSGIKSHQTRMDVIGNNISNINTIGFKSSRVTFSDMLSQTSYNASRPSATTGGTNPRQIGLGEAVSSIDMIMNDGSAQATGKNTDVALSGNGFMILSKGTDKYYTRDGAFEFDANGNYVLPGSGYYVQGWNAIDGTLTTSGVPENIVVKSGKTMPATATTNLDYAGNLNAGALTITSITYTGDPSGDSKAVANDQQLNEMHVTYTDGTTDTITAQSIDYSEGDTDTTETMAGKTVRVGQNRKVLSEDGTTLVTKTVASVGFEMTSVHGAEASGTFGSDTATYNFTSGSFTIYDPGDGSEGSGDSTTLTTQSVNVDGSNVIAATLTLSDGSSLKVSSGFYEIGHSVPVTTVSTVYDAEGNMHSVTLLMDKAGENEWRTYIAPTVSQKGYQTVVAITEDDGTSTNVYLNRQEDATTGETSTKLSNVTFTSLGAIDTALTSGGSLYLDYDNGNGAQPTTVAVSFNDITQYSGSNTVYPTTDGNSLGILNSIAIDVNGVISGTYTNGIIQTEAQIAVAQFINSAGLNKQGTSLYKESNNSGAARVGTVGDFGFAFTPSALEMSNVELSAELVDMIVTQRGFQSNSKVITVGDEMLETIVNMKR
ncbi:MAG: flagellar hook-basal body complex protein [Selenomonadaceae bacterium]|nr:flagellar hook-basal body complex protein [Selenomonadaceae bacterium]